MGIQTITLDPDAQNIEDQSINVRNETGSALVEGDLVFVSGWDEATLRWLVEKAEAPTFGGNLAQFVMRSSLADVTDGVAFKSHRLTNLDTSSAAVGDPIYLSDTVPGEFTLVTPNFARQIVGRVAVVDAVTGEIELFVQSDSDTGFIRTNPGSGEFPVRGIQRDADGNIEIDFDDVSV